MELVGWMIAIVFGEPRLRCEASRWAP